MLAARGWVRNLTAWKGWMSTATIPLLCGIPSFNGQTKQLTSTAYPFRSWVKHTKPWKAALLSRKLKGNKPATEWKTFQKWEKNCFQVCLCKGLLLADRPQEQSNAEGSDVTCHRQLALLEMGWNLHCKTVPVVLQKWHSSLCGAGGESFAPRGFYCLLLKNAVIFLTFTNVLTQ